uniref:choice-of-anchor A family protein n=1 Tax=Flavobacterium sp. WG21 TaxID=1229487 RepID=UPI0012FCC7C2
MLNKITLKLRQLQLTFILCFLSLFSGWNVFAEGSKDLFPSGATGNRSWMTSSTQNIRLGSGMFIGGVNQGRHYVYVNAGETIYVGSSAQGIASGTINFRTPSGTVYSSGTDKVTGLIASRAEELAGPAALSPGGYKAYSKIVGPSEAGIWEIEFISPVPSATPNTGTTVLAANASWTSTNAAHQPTNNSLILAWDITVASGTVVKPGRTFLNVFTGNMGANTRAFRGKFRVLTIDGYRYLVDGNGMDPFVFAFFSNNNGVKSRATGLPIYKSVDMVDVENNTNSASPSTTPYLYYPPENFGSGNDVTNKLFYQDPDLTMPTSASVNVGGSTVTTWLVNNVVTAAISNIFISGSEGSVGVGTPPLGSYINFTASTNGNALVQIDGDNDGVYTGNKDRIILVAAKMGENKIYWDGKFKDGTYASTGLNLNLNVVIFNGEVHFPYVDAENNASGFLVSRLNGNSPDDKIYWDDSLFATVTGESNPKTNTTFPGLSSASNGHKWSSSYGDNRTLDSWAYVTTTSPVVTVPVVQNAADLAVTSISDVTTGSVGTDVTYTVVVKNIGGPNNVTGAKFKFSDLVSGANLAVQSFTSSSTLGGAVTTHTITGGVLDATVDLPKDATITFTIIGKILAPAGTNVNVKATIMRPQDLTDPDATADTHVGTPPVDPDVECDGTPSGVGCNNIKTDVFTVTSSPLPFPSTTNSCLGVFLSDVISSNPPTSIYKPATFTGDFIGRDNAINFAVGGNLTITNGAEYEGRSFVYGNFTMNKTSAFNLGVAGVGSFIVPDDNKNILTIGGNFDASAASGNLILGGESGNGQKSYGTIVYKGTKSPNVKITGDASKVINEATLDLTPYNDAFNALQVSSTAWNQLPSDPNVTFANDGFGTYTFTCLTPAVSKSYVINIPNVLASRPNGTINFVGFPDNASLLINVPGTTTNFNIATFQFNGVTQAVGSGNKTPANEVAPFSLRILWNLPTATTVSLKGAQFWGSMVIPQRTGTVTNEMIGMNGRFIVGGNLIQNIGGSETHNYPFKGEISTTDAPIVTTPVNYCQDETATALTATGSNLKWYTAQTGGVGSATAPTPVTTAVGTTTYYVSQTVGNCESARTAIDVVVKERPVKPTTGTVTQPTCSVATGSFTISNYNAAYTYLVNPSTGVTVSGATVTAPAGTYTVTATLGTCSSVVSDDVVINAQPSTPVKPTAGTVTQPTCSVATGSFAISNYNAAYTYSVNPSTGVTVSGATVTAPAGNYTVTATLGTCSSVVSDNVVINAQPSTPVKP